jgi:predicted nucleotidyltransferase component of viral defense system
LSSGSKKRPRGRKPPTSRATEPRPPELVEWQVAVLHSVAATSLADEAVFGGGAALAVRHLHHRTSEDLDFFFRREIEPADLRALKRDLVRAGFELEEEAHGPRRSLVLLREGEEVGRVDFAFYPYDPIGRRERWRGLAVESFIDMAVNKLQAVLTRFQARDFVDLYFLLREGPERDLDRLLDLVRAKFDAGADRLALANRILLARNIAELPAMLRPLSLAELLAFCEEKAREVARTG